MNFNYLYQPQILQAPPKTIEEFFWKTSRRKCIRLDGTFEYPKFEEFFMALLIKICHILCLSKLALTYKGSIRIASR